MENKEKKSTGKAGTIVGIIMCVILIPILVVNVTMIIKSYADPEKVPTFGGYAPMIVLTDSMVPTIDSGDLIVIHTVDPEDLKEGDIISFFDPESIGNAVVTHRIIEVLSENGALSFRTRGDGNNADDALPVPAASVVGLYQTRLSGLGNVAMFLQTVPGLIVCVAVPIVLLVGYDLIMKKRYDKAKKQDTDALLKELEALRAMQAANGGSADSEPKNEE